VENKNSVCMLWTAFSECTISRRLVTYPGLDCTIVLDKRTLDMKPWLLHVMDLNVLQILSLGKL
jgi:hypothetical protein